MHFIKESILIVLSLMLLHMMKFKYLLPYHDSATFISTDNVLNLLVLICGCQWWYWFVARGEPSGLTIKGTYLNVSFWLIGNWFQEHRKRLNSTIQIQAFTRSYLTRKHCKQYEREDFDHHFSRMSSEDLEQLSTLLAKLLFFYDDQNDVPRMVCTNITSIHCK